MPATVIDRREPQVRYRREGSARAALQGPQDGVAQRRRGERRSSIEPVVPSILPKPIPPCPQRCYPPHRVLKSVRAAHSLPKHDQILENLDLVAARLSCRKQRDGRRWVVSRAKRVAAESGSLVHRVASRLDGVLYFFKVFPCR